MADKWCFSWDNKEFGPFSAIQLRDLAALGRLQPADMVWKQGTEKKVRADRIHNLFMVPEAAVVLAQPSVSAYSSSQQPAGEHSPLVPNSGAKLTPWLPSAAEQDTAGEELQDPIPDGLLLRANAEEETPPIAPPANVAKVADKKLPTPPAARKGRARAVSGAVITSQDGEIVRFMKKCIKCDYQDNCNTVMPIRQGTSRVSFFCPKCKKMREAAIEGIR